MTANAELRLARIARRDAQAALPAIAQCEGIGAEGRCRASVSPRYDGGATVCGFHRREAKRKAA